MNSKGYAVILVLVILGAVLPYWSQSTDASRGHPDVWLKNEQGNRIAPGRNSVDPYSPRRSCGGCHGYMTITSGYHFQQGFDRISDRYDLRRPWILSPGMYGNWSPFAATALLARKVNSDILRMNLSTYDWIGGWGKLYPEHKVRVPACGWCHPGGGPLEFGRGADGRADYSANLAEAESRISVRLDGDYSSRLTPDGMSHFRQSGVLEADCLICHLPGYRFEARIRQINAKNYRWAATAGAGLGRISGAVFSYGNPAAGTGHPGCMEGVWNFSKRPVVSYAWEDGRLFSKEGRLKGRLISRSVDRKNCLQCHAESEAKNTGTLHESSSDVHVLAGLQCTDCHGLIGRTARERLRHQIAKGWSPTISVRDDLDGVGMKTCVGCHQEGRYRPSRKGLPAQAPDPRRVHGERFSGAGFHTYLIDCSGCHSTAQPARALYLLDLGTGQEKGYTAEGFDLVLSPTDYLQRAKVPWKPWMCRLAKEKGQQERYRPDVPKLLTWFGERTSTGEIRPIDLGHVSKAAGKLSSIDTFEVRTTSGVRMKSSLIASERNIRSMIENLTKMGFRRVVYVADRFYEMKKGQLVAGNSGQELRKDIFPVEHDVTPLSAKSTYGAGGVPEGCLDCHSDGSIFFTKMRIKNMKEFLHKDYPKLKEPHAEPQMSSWGLATVPSVE
ncbi:MAG: hypothetical protein JW950_06125 [Deltaproteobacteria bacterium]|nr:hypothetical protein [Deltaproteobacteria bacterium]